MVLGVMLVRACGFASVGGFGFLILWLFMVLTEF